MNQQSIAKKIDMLEALADQMKSIVIDLRKELIEQGTRAPKKKDMQKEFIRAALLQRVKARMLKEPKPKK